jgi:hypothetical protein
MTSQVNEQLTNYDANYPVAGQDNDTVKFRLNFAAIQSAFNQADVEITALQSHTAKTNTDTDFNGSIISNAFTNKLYGVVNNSVSGAGGDLSVILASYFIINSINGNVTFNLTDWPTTGTSIKEFKIRIELNGQTGNQVTFQGQGGIVIKRDDSGQISAGVSGGTQKVTLTVNKPTVLEFWRVGASDILMKYLGTFQS